MLWCGSDMMMMVVVAVAMAEGDMGKARPRGTAAVKTPEEPRSPRQNPR